MMVALLQNLLGFSEKISVTFARAPEPEYKVGDCRAEYTMPTAEELAAEDPALVDLYNSSKPVSR